MAPNDTRAQRPTADDLRAIDAMANVGDDDRSTMQKMKDNPFVPAGITCGIGALGYMLYNIKNSKNKLSVHLIHTRMATQGVIVGALAIGVVYKIINDHILHNDEKPKKN